jgi:hypothetical protein
MAKSVHSNLDFLGSTRIINLPSPTASGDAAPKSYVDSAIEGLAWKDSCRVATQGNISIASPGATIDGVTMALNDRVLVKAQTTGSENGIYVWNGAAVPLTRAFDAVTANDLEQAVVTVEEGTSAGSSFRQTLVNFVIGTGAPNFVSFGASVGAASTTSSGIVRLATQAEVDAGTDATIAVTPATLAATTQRPRKFSAVFGDGSSTQYDIAHNFGTNDVVVEVYRSTTPFDSVLCDVGRPTTNSVRLNFAVAPTSNQFRCVVVG